MRHFQGEAKRSEEREEEEEGVATVGIPSLPEF
jgi:hypothetical protein